LFDEESWGGRVDTYEQQRVFTAPFRFAHAWHGCLGIVLDVSVIAALKAVGHPVLVAWQRPGAVFIAASALALPC
jgi:predicted benzoate:H+ symporter BenE